MGMHTCRKLIVISIRLYELIPPVKTSLRSRCKRNCFSTKTRRWSVGNEPVEKQKRELVRVKVGKSRYLFRYGLTFKMTDQFCTAHSITSIEANIHFDIS